LRLPLGLGLIAWLAFAFLNMFALGLCWFDKRRAQRGGRRIRERALLLVALLGGSPGIVVGMVLVHHKVRKPSFLARLLVVVVLQAIAVALASGRVGLT
jgi:uncharacterized membrane protein YsdA (DUF1294 family)